MFRLQYYQTFTKTTVEKLNANNNVCAPFEYTCLDLCSGEYAAIYVFDLFAYSVLILNFGRFSNTHFVHTCDCVRSVRAYISNNVPFGQDVPTTTQGYTKANETNECVQNK